MTNSSYRVFKEIFARIWALWGIITFIVTFLIIFLPSMCAYLFRDEKKGQEYFIYIARIWMDTWLFLIACPVKIIGKEYFKNGENYVVVFNHNTLLDVPLSAPYVPGANKTIAKSSFAKVPLFGFFYSRGSILVNRNKEASRRKSYELMLDVLKKGMHMCLYPEGTRNRTQEPLKPFYDGAFKVACSARKDVIPCILIGTKKAMPVEKLFFLYPVKLKMIFLPPVSSAEKTVQQLKEEVYSVMKQTYIENQYSTSKVNI